MTQNTKIFKFKDIFEIHKGSRLTKEDMIEGSVNFLGAIDSNNGVRQKINVEPKFTGKYITVNYNGSVGEAFYQTEPFWASDDVNVLELKEYTLTENIAMFLITVIKANRSKFSYGRKWTKGKMLEDEILLPMDNYGKPNWEFMEKFIRGLGIVKPTTKNYGDSTKNLDTTNWKEFRLGDLFTQTRGKEKAPKQNDDGDIILINEIEDNNGFTRKVVPTKIFKGNAITISINFAKNVFYQKDDFCASVNISIIRNKDLNKYTGLFLASLLSQLYKRYSYGFKISKDKIDNTVIKLPATIGGTPDWFFMENYIKCLPFADRI